MKTLGLLLFGFIFIFGVIFSALAFGCQDDWCFLFQWQKVRATNNFVECATRGFPIMESFPRQCKAGNKTFVEEIPQN